MKKPEYVPYKQPVVPIITPIIPEKQPIIEQKIPIIPEMKTIIPEKMPIIPEKLPIIPEMKPVIEEKAPTIPEKMPIVPEQPQFIPIKDPVIPQKTPILPTPKYQIPPHTPNEPQQMVTPQPCDAGWMYCNPLPCDVYECAAYPDAICTNNKCGQCSAQFKDKNGNILTPQQCAGIPDVFKMGNELSRPSLPQQSTLLKISNELTPNGNRLIPSIGSVSSSCTQGIVQCAKKPCTVQKCYAYPSATCENDYCGGCNAIFYDTKGVELSKSQCAGGNILTALNGGNFPQPTTTKATTASCIGHRKTGCSVDSDCCRSDGVCLRGRCRRDRRSASLRSVSVDAKFDNFEAGAAPKSDGNSGSAEVSVGGMMVSVWSVGFVFIALMVVVPIMYYWYYQKYLVRKFKKAARREIFHGLEINDHSDHEFADSEDTNDGLFVE